ncbi:MAG TPA: DUF1707 domain-containing protein [Solirubrobacteraceae bacterium]|jgi:hypothetical protein
MTEHHSFRTEGIDDDRIRAGDRDRERAAEILRHHHGEGRIDTDELQERIDRCLQAKTIGELDRLLADLPGQGRARPRSSWSASPWRWPLVASIPALIVLAAISSGHGHRHPFWLLIPVVFLITRLLIARRGRWPVFGGHDREDRRL